MQKHFFVMILKLEVTYFVLIVGHFLLTVLLTDQLIAAAPSRVVTVSSTGHQISNIRLDNISPAEEDYNRIFAYSHSKQANILFSAELGRRLKGQNIHLCASFYRINSQTFYKGFQHVKLKRYITRLR